MASKAIPEISRSNVAQSRSINLIDLLGRLALASVFFVSGVEKIIAPTYTIGYIQSVGLPFPTIAYAAAVIVEIVGSIILVTGYRVREVSVILAGFTLVTAFTFHFNLADGNQLYHFFKNIAIVGGLLQVISGFARSR